MRAAHLRGIVSAPLSELPMTLSRLLPVLVLPALVLLAWGLDPSTADDVGAPVRDGVFVHISHGGSSGDESAHRALMGLKMAKLMAASRDVLVYLDVTGVELAVAGADASTHPAFAKSTELIREIMAKGGRIVVCPTCLRGAGHEADALREGIALADAEVFFSFTKGRILSLDY